MNSPLVRWIGRTAVVPNGVHLGFPGVHCVLAGDFSSVRARIHATSNDVHIRIGLDNDFSRKIRLYSGANTVELIDEPFSGEITLFKCTEAWQGIIEIEGFELDGITTVPKPRNQKLMFIGDSITCGGGVLLREGSVLNDSITNDAYHSFGMELGRRLDAEVHLVSYGGRGLYRDWQGFTSEKINNAPDFFERATPDDSQSLWDHQQFQPNVIVIGLGQNDFNQGIVPLDIWVPACQKFLTRVRAVHPRAKIVLTNSPMQGAGLVRETLTSYLKTVILNQKDPGITFVEIAHHKGSAVDSHPDLGQHLLMADTLEPTIKSLL